MILITGATGFVAHAVVRRLTDEQSEFRCLLHPSQRRQQLPTGIPLPAVSASITDGPALRKAMYDVTAVVHLMKEESPDQDGTLHDHVKGTTNLIASAQRAGVRRFVYLSRLAANSASAYPLFRVRGQAEVAVRESGLDYTILRSAVTYGPHDSFTNVLVMLAKAIPLVMPIPDAGMSSFQPLWIEDLVTCIVAALDRDDLIGKTVPLGGSEHFTLEQMVTEILEAARMRRRLMHVRIPLIRAMIELFEALLPRTPTPFWWLDLAAAGSATELGAIPRNFDFEPRRFAQCLDYLRPKQPWRRNLIRLLLQRQ